MDMRRAAYVLVLIMLATACGAGSHPAPVDLAQTGGSPYGEVDTAKAKQQFEQLVKDDPRNKYGWYNLGVLAQYEGKTREATANYRKTIDLDANFEGALYNLGLLRYQASDNDEAISLFRRAIAITPTDAKAHWNLGLALTAKNGSEAMNKEATKELNAAIKLDKSLLAGLKPAKGTTTSTTASSSSVTTTSAAATP
jgi:tetratricopeptide (TPR) repeat protein